MLLVNLFTEITPLKLIAIFLTIASGAFSAYLNYKRKLIKSAPPEKRSQLIDKTLTKYNWFKKIDTNSLSEDGKLKVILQGFKTRVTTLSILALTGIICLCVIFFFGNKKKVFNCNDETLEVIGDRNILLNQYSDKIRTFYDHYRVNHKLYKSDTLAFNEFISIVTDYIQLREDFELSNEEYVKKLNRHYVPSDFVVSYNSLSKRLTEDIHYRLFNDVDGNSFNTLNILMDEYIKCSSNCSNIQSSFFEESGKWIGKVGAQLIELDKEISEYKIKTTTLCT